MSERRSGPGRHPSRKFQETDSDDQKTALLLSLLIAGIGGSALAIGGVHVPVLATVSAIFLACAVICFRRDQLARLPVPVLVCFALAIFTFFQGLPLPRALLTSIAPTNADVWDRALRPFHEAGPAWASISLDPGASFVEGLKWLTYSGVLLAAFELGRAGKAPHVVAAVFSSALLVALATIFHGLFDATRVFGVYTPDNPGSPWHLGPLLNPNNLAGYLNLGACCGLGLLMSSRNPLPTWMVWVGEAAIIGCDLMSGSRGGFLALPLGLVLIVVLVRRSALDRRKRTRWHMPLIAAGSVIGGVGLAALSFEEHLAKELYNANLIKLRMAVWAKPMIFDHPWLGVGRGAFESTFPAYRTLPGRSVFTHAENFVVQWTAEWGIPVALIALAWLGWTLRPRRSEVTRTALGIASFTGVMVVLLQNFVDLGLELPAVFIAIFAVLGCWHGVHARRRVQAGTSENAPMRRIRTIVAAVTWSGAVLLALLVGIRDVTTERQSLHAELGKIDSSHPGEREALRRRIHAAILRHPAEPYFPLVGSILAVRAADQDPMPWIQRSLERALVNGQAHFILAHVLANRRAIGQALLELRLAVGADPELAPLAAQSASVWARHYDELIAAVPPGSAGVGMLEDLASLIPPEQRRQILVEAIRRDGERGRAREMLVRQDLGELRGTLAAGFCGPERIAECEREIETQTRELRRLLPAHSVADRLFAEFLAIKGDPAQAEKLLAQRCPDASDRLLCLSHRAEVAAQVPEPEPFATAARELSAMACGSATDCAEISTMIGDLLAKRREWGQALSHYLRACDLQPTPECWLRVARAASARGAHAQSAQAFEQAYKLSGRKDPSLRESIEIERAKAMGTQL